MNYHGDEKLDTCRRLKDDGNSDNVEKFTKAFSLPLKIIPLFTDIKLAIGNNRFVSYNLYEGKKKFHIHQFETIDDILIPSKQGNNRLNNRLISLKRIGIIALSLIMSLTFGFTSNKRPTAVYMNYAFNQYSKNNKGCVHWRCVEYTRFKCRAKLVTFKNKMLENSTPLHTHPTTKLSATQKYVNDVHAQLAYSRPCNSFPANDKEQKDKLEKLLCSTLSHPTNSEDMDAKEKKSKLQTLCSTLDLTANCKDMDEMSDEEFLNQFSRFHKNREATPELRLNNSMVFNAEPATSKTLLRIKNIRRGPRKNSKLLKKSISSHQIKWLDY
jgi:hypothetical protein